ncbi:hypothetical protein QWZ10_01925 [Paracoccus cavernae]|uniref:Glycosyltransferase n=1 Tax=Paracoccus cavernae TaxID=1571207 RepID=A0ABT8D267_9RHOB|nr:hypothetical protein [Paracoccus cavernae]
MSEPATPTAPTAAVPNGPSSADPVLVICIKWGTLYGADDVNRLAAGVRRHLARPHRFICFTDDALGLDAGIEAMALPELGLPKGHKDTRWQKLALFRKDLFGLKGTGLFLDLDLVIVDDLEPFFALPGEFFIIRDDDLFRPKPCARSIRRATVSCIASAIPRSFAMRSGRIPTSSTPISPIRRPRRQDTRSASSSKAPSSPNTAICITGRAGGVSASKTTVCRAIS